MWRWVLELASGDQGAAAKRITLPQLAWLEHGLSRALATPFPGQRLHARQEVEDLEVFASLLATYSTPKGRCESDPSVYWCEADPGINGGCVCQELRFSLECWLMQRDQVEWRVHLRPNSLRAIVWRRRISPLNTAVLSFAHDAAMYWPATEVLEGQCKDLAGRALRAALTLPLMRVWWERTQTLCGVGMPVALQAAEKASVLEEALARLDLWKRDVPDAMTTARETITAALPAPAQKKALQPMFQAVRRAVQFERDQFAPILSFDANVEIIFVDIIRGWPADHESLQRREAFLAALLAYQANPSVQYLQHHSHIIEKLQLVLHSDRTDRGSATEAEYGRGLRLRVQGPADSIERVAELASMMDWLIKRIHVLCLLDTSKWLGSLQIMTDMVCLHYGIDMRASVRMRRMISQWRWLFGNAVPALYCSWFSADVAPILLDFLFQDDAISTYTLYGLRVGTIAHRLLAFTAIYTITNPSLDTAETEELDEYPPSRWQAIARGEYLPTPDEEAAMTEEEVAQYASMRCERVGEMVKRCEMAQVLANESLHRLQPVYPIQR